MGMIGDQDTGSTPDCPLRAAIPPNLFLDKLDIWVYRVGVPQDSHEECT
jgi:hypothetical protein